MSKGKGLASLVRWKKCQRRVANAALRAAHAGKHPRSAELKRAANALASIACSKGGKAKRQGKRKGHRFSKRDYRREQEAELRALRIHSPHEPPFNPELSY